MNKNEDEDVAFQILIAIKLKKLEMKIHFQIIRNATSNIVRNQHVIIKEESNSCNSWLLIGKRRAVSPKV